jgi:sugar phosphate isomerase/epimerase
MKYTRSKFLKLVGLSASAALVTTRAMSGTSAKTTLSKAKSNLELGLASYTLRKFNLDDVIKMSQRVGLKSIALKSMHMPLESSAEDIKKMAEKIRAAGLRLYGAGVIYMNTEKEVETTFAYAANAGLEMIIGVPKYDLLPLVNEKVKSLNIKLAIHNHGPGDDLYSSPDHVYAKIKDLDKRIGLCIDIGHVTRIGQDPVAMIQKYKDRLYDIHMKDVNKNVAEGTPVEVGRGIIPIPEVIKALNKINYQGVVAFEYEKDGDDPMPGLAESVGYIRGIIKMS